MLSSQAVGRALTLRERLAHRRPTGSPEPPVASAQAELERWRAQRPFSEDPGLWEARLGATGVQEPDLLLLLTENPVEAAERLDAGPQWLDVLTAAYGAASRVALAPAGTGGSMPEFVAFVAPLLAAGRARLRSRLEAVAWPPGVDPRLVEDQLSRSLPWQLNRMVARTMALEVNRARLAGELSGDTPEERFLDFVGGLATPATQRRMLERYPVLGRQLAVSVRWWVDASAELVSRLCADYDSLVSHFHDGRDPGHLTEITAGLGERHRHGRTVAALEWQSGLRLVYKPRPVGIDVQFQRLLDWLNSAGVSHRFRRLAYLARDDYGWAEYAHPEPCVDESARHRFYFRTGGLLAALHILRANDLHAENLIAAGDQPVVVDLESLAQPRPLIADSDLNEAERQAADVALGSVLRVGMLPVGHWQHDGDAVDTSGLGWQPGQRTSVRLATLEGTGTDTMQVRLDRLPMGTPDHRPVGPDEPLRLLDYADDILTGFTETYDILCRHRSGLLAEGGALRDFGHATVRVIARDTLLYSTVLRTGFHPDLLGSALRRDAHLDNLWRGMTSAMTGLVDAEQRDLWNNDIPVFTARVDGETLFDSTGARVPGVRLRSGMSQIREAVRDLGPVDRARQLWLVRGSLATTLLDAGIPGSIPRYLLQPGPAPASEHRLLTAAAAVGDRLAQIAFQADGRAQWLGVNSNRGLHWSFGPLSYDLFHGLGGVAVFLGELGVATGERRYLELARRALATALDQLDREPAAVGGMAGLPGAAWALCRLSRLVDAEELVDAAERYVARLAPVVAQDRQFDVVGGAAGTILALRALHQLRPGSRASDLIRACADHLVATARPFPPGCGWVPRSVSESWQATTPLAGMAHGQAGIAWALLEAAAIVDDGRYRVTAEAALRYEDTLRDPAIGNWPNPPTAQPFEEAANVTWCHGAPGVGLSRVGCLPHLPSRRQRAREDIEIAVATTLRDGVGRNHCLCHGDFGNLELVLQAATALGREDLRTRAGRIVAGILDGIDADGWRCGVVLGPETPSLLVGLAGIGYGMLRFAMPDRVPAVVTLDPAPRPVPDRE